jgi:hypothetical protein
MLNTPSHHSKLWALIVASLLFACSEGIFKKGIKEGVIEYTISYPDIPENSYMLDLLPKKMETAFSNGEFRNDIIAGMGIFKTSLIRLEENKGIIHSVKLLNERVASELQAEDIERFNPAFRDLQIEPTKGGKEIAGYYCKEAKVTVKGDSTWTFTIYYTEEIDIEKANQLSPFEAVEGVLMEYHVISHDLHMHIQANRVLEKKIDTESLRLEDNYVMVSPGELSDKIESLFEKIK